MTVIHVYKLILLALMWSAGWCCYFIHIEAYPGIKNLSITFAPFIAWIVYFMIFVW